MMSYCSFSLWKVPYCDYPTMPSLKTIEKVKSSPTLSGLYDLLHFAWIRLKVSFQLLKVISPTASWIRWCMNVCGCRYSELIWTNLAWLNDLSCRMFFGYQATDSILPQMCTTESLRPLYYWLLSQPASCLTHLLLAALLPLVSSTKLRSANLPGLHLWCDTVGDQMLASTPWVVITTVWVVTVV